MESEQRTVLVENTTRRCKHRYISDVNADTSNDIAHYATHHVMPKYIRENFKNSSKYPVFVPGSLSNDQVSSY